MNVSPVRNVTSFLQRYRSVNRMTYCIHERYVTTTNSDGGPYDIVVVGGGIVGTATARELLFRNPSLRLAVVEKENKLAAHQSGHNSGVIHAGIYYKPGSLKAKLCVEGLHLAYDFFEKEGIPYKKCGKLIVAVEEEEIPRLMDLYDRALQNGVPDVELIDGSRIKEFEPYCKGVKAIWSPHTGIVDWGLVTEYYGKNIKSMGGDIHLNFPVTGFEMASDNKREVEEAKKYPVVVKSNDKTLQCSYVLTCGGLHSDRLANMSGCSGDKQILPFRGEYLLLKPEKAHMIRGNIYPVPDPRFPFLGVHFTPRMNGDIWLGPNAVLSLKREGYRWRDINLHDLYEAVTFRGFQKLALQYVSFGLKEVLRSIFPSLQVSILQKFIPEITRKDIVRGPAGVRAQALSIDGSLVDDFVFQREVNCEVGSRILHCMNAPSPGATSSLAIAKMIADKLHAEFNL